VFSDLASVRVRRLLYLASVLILVLAVALRVWLGEGEDVRQIGRELTSNIAAVILVWVLSIAFLGVFFARERQAHETRVVDGDRSAKEFSTAASNAAIWFHHGHIGRWVRENVLPALAVRSARSPAPLQVIVILLDPRADAVCQGHADRRNSRRRKDSTPYTARHIKIEIASTILALARANAALPNFTARVFVSDLDMPFRLDLCDDYGFITHEDQTAPAFAFESESPYYATSSAYFERFRSSGAREVNLGASSLVDGEVAQSSVKEILAMMDLDFPELDQRNTRDDIAHRARYV
jgi:hypothetical protein